MRTIYSPDQLLHDPRAEFHRGEFTPSFESPRRAEQVLDAVVAAGMPVEPPRDFAGLGHLERVHTPEFVAFLQGAWDEWASLGRGGDALPVAWPVRGARQDRVPECLDGRLSFYSCDMATPIGPGTWRAAKAAADIAATGAVLLAAGEAAAVFGLCRPPGHHASQDVYGGYCYLNNAAIAAQLALDSGARRVAIVDVDYHHGNGTQRIFEARGDVFFASIHADPATDYPYFGGYADERGTGAGVGCTLNLPLPRGTGWDVYGEALDAACAAVAEFGGDLLVVSLGVDTFVGDPISAFRLRGEDYRRIGARLAALERPALFLLEGGYAVDEIGANVVEVLRGFAG